jgi:hypothetical protein
MPKFFMRFYGPNASERAMAVRYRLLSNDFDFSAHLTSIKDAQGRPGTQMDLVFLNTLDRDFTYQHLAVHDLCKCFGGVIEVLERTQEPS